MRITELDFTDGKKYNFFLHDKHIEERGDDYGIYAEGMLLEVHSGRLYSVDEFESRNVYDFYSEEELAKGYFKEVLE